jgi:zinc transport system substrate-binding protein
MQMSKSRRFSYLCVLINRMKTLKRILCSAFAIAACVSCGATQEPSEGKLVVTIEPLRYIVEQIVGDDFEVETLVPPGASPETYEPTPRQMQAMEDAEIIFSTGVIDFERVVLGKASAPERFVELSAGIELIASEHDHKHGSDHAHENEHAEAQHSTHSEHDEAAPAHSHSGVDPHIWVSPRALAQMARTAYSKIHELYPDSTSYTAGYEQLAACLTELDRSVSNRLATSHVRSCMIFHPGHTDKARQ